MNLLKKYGLSLFIFLAFVAYFLVLFHQFPANNSLPGNTDTIYNIVIFEDYGNRVLSWFSEEPIGNSLYPHEMMQQYAELYLGHAAIYSVFSLFTANDIFAYYLYISLLFALNGWGAYCLGKYLTNSNSAGILIGFILSSSSFAFSQLELLNGIPYAWYCLSLLFFLKFLHQKAYKFAIIAAVLAAIQFYFSNYIFIYLILSLVATVFIYQKTYFLQTRFYKQMVPLAILGIVLLIPYGIIADWGLPIKEAFNPIDLVLIKKFSISINDLWRHLPKHRLYDLTQPQIINETVKNVNFLFPGFGAIFLFIISLFSQRNSTVKKLGLWILVIGTLLGLGPFLGIGATFYKMPLYPLYSLFDLHELIRIPPRAFTLAILGIAIVIGQFVAKRKQSIRYSIVTIFVIIFFLENVPKQFQIHPSKELLSVPEAMLHLSEAESIVNVGILPSSILSDKPYNSMGVSEYSREYIYSYWQTKCKFNMINGMCGYFPENRLSNNELMMRANEAGSLHSLIQNNKLDYIILNYNRLFHIDPNDLKMLDAIKQMDFLQIISESEDVVILAPK